MANRDRLAAGSRFYLPQLDGLRFLAFLLVFLHHAPLAPGLSLLRGLKVFGWAGVDLFFCLSAFLLTRLLVLERASRGRIGFARFFARRSLRIWPLYYLAVAIGFFLLPHWLRGFGPMAGTPAYDALLRDYLVPHLAFYANFADGVLGYPMSAAVVLLWTISAEEQFYLLLPLGIAVLPLPPGRAGARLCLAILLVSLLLRAGCLFARLPHPIVYANPFARPEPFLVGAVLAFLTDRARLRSLLGQPLLPLVGLLPLVAVALGPPIQDQSVHVLWQYGALALGFGAWVGHLAVASSGLARLLSLRPLVFAGRISYGLYVYHLIALTAMKRIELVRIGRPGSYGWPEWALFVGAALAFTLALAALSYYGFERWFLLLKRRYEVVPSRPVTPLPRS